MSANDTERNHHPAPWPRTALGAVLLLLMATAAGAQNYSLDFGHNLGVWTWDHEARWSQELSQGFTVAADGTYEKRVSSAQFRSRSARGATDFTYTLTPKLDLTTNLSGRQEVQTIGSSRSTVEEARARSGVTYRPTSEVALSSSVGWGFDKRRGVSDDGLVYGLGLRATPFQSFLASNGASVTLDYTRAAVSSSQGDVMDALLAEGSFLWTDDVRQTLSYTELRNDQKYVSTTSGNPILGRMTMSRVVQAGFEAHMGIIGRLAANGGYTWGKVDDDANDDPNTLKYLTNNITTGWTGALSWAPAIYTPSLLADFTFSSSARDAEDVWELVPESVDSLRFVRNALDRNTENMTLALSSGIALTRRDSLRVSGSLSISRDHTPAEDEVNDRDDYRRSIVGIYRHVFVHGSAMELRVERTETHKVWLKSQRSANNHWERVLNMWATSTMQLGRLALKETGYFHTSLEEYDYDYLTPEDPRSRNMRIARFSFDGNAPVAGMVVEGTLSLEARTRGNLIGAEPGKPPSIWS